MQVAEVLSDLTSLRVCEHSDALNLVTVNEKIPSQSTTTANTTTGDSTTLSQANTDTARDQVAGSDRDLQRAKELVDLHRELKTKHVDGVVDEGLARARADVGRVWGELRMRG